MSSSSMNSEPRWSHWRERDREKSVMANLLNNLWVPLGRNTLS